METPRAPRKTTGGVDFQLNDFEDALRQTLEYNLTYNINRDHWREFDELSHRDIQMLRHAVNATFIDMRYVYQPSREITLLLANAETLIQNVLWAAMNVPWPLNPQYHVERVVDNVLDVYWMEIYPALRTEMIMVNHAIGILQRNWRRCVSNPAHPVCRRRLEHEFNTMIA